MPRYGHIADVFLTNIRTELTDLNTKTAKITSTVTRKPFSLTFAAAGDQAAWTPAAGKAVRIHLISFDSSADVEVGWRFGTTETSQVCRTTKGPYVANMVGCNSQGAADQALNIRAEGAVTVKGYVLGEEV